MLQNPRQLGRQGIEPADGDAELAVVEGPGPGGGAGNVKESLLGIERDENVIARWRTEITHQIVVVGLQRSQDLSTECFRSLLALVVHNEMAAFTLGKICLDVLLALRFFQVLLDGGIGTQFQRMLPGGNSFFGMVRSLLRIAQHGVGIGRPGRGAHGTLCVSDSLRRAPRPHQQGSVVDKDS